MRDDITLGKRRRLSITQREIDLDKDISRCCHARIRMRSIYPYSICCSECNYDLEFEHEIIFKKEKP